MREHALERPRHLVEVERVDEEARVPDLSPRAAPQETAKLFLGAPSPPRGLLLEGAKGAEVALRVDDLLHGRGTEGADQLGFQVVDAHVEPERFHVGASELGAEAGPLEPTPEVDLLCGVAEPGQPEVQPAGPEVVQGPADRLRTPDWDDGDALGVEIPAVPLRKRFHRPPVADPFHEHHRTRSSTRRG
jgi:hypothetical protein